MRGRLWSLLTVTALAFAPLSGLVCELACRPVQVVASASWGSGHAAHAACHEAAGAKGPAVQRVPHHCEHPEPVLRPVETVARTLVSSSTILASTSALPFAAIHIVRGRALVSASPPRPSPLPASFTLTPLRV